MWTIPPPMFAIPPPPLAFIEVEFRIELECNPKEVFSSFMLTATTAWVLFPKLDRNDAWISLDWVMPEDIF